MVRRDNMPTGQARGPRLVARGKRRAFFEGKSSPLASGPAPLARTVARDVEGPIVCGGGSRFLRHALGF